MIIPYINNCDNIKFIDSIHEQLPLGMNNDTIYIEPSISEYSMFIPLIERFKFKNAIINIPDDNLYNVYHQLKHNVYELIGDLEELYNIHNSLNDAGKIKLYDGTVDELNNISTCPILKSIYFIFIHSINTNYVYDRMHILRINNALTCVHLKNTNPIDIIISDSNTFYYICPEVENAALAANSRFSEFLISITNLNQKFLLYSGYKNY